MKFNLLTMLAWFIPVGLTIVFIQSPTLLALNSIVLMWLVCIAVAFRPKTNDPRPASTYWIPVGLMVSGAFSFVGGILFSIAHMMDSIGPKGDWVPPAIFGGLAFFVYGSMLLRAKRKPVMQTDTDSD